MTQQITELPALWQEAEQHIRAFEQLARRTVEEAWLAGDALLRIKEQLPARCMDTGPKGAGHTPPHCSTVYPLAPKLSPKTTNCRICQRFGCAYKEQSGLEAAWRQVHIRSVRRRPVGLAADGGDGPGPSPAGRGRADSFQWRGNGRHPPALRTITKTTKNAIEPWAGSDWP